MKSWPRIRSFELIVIALVSASVCLAGTGRADHLTMSVWPAGKLPGHGASQPERELPSKGDNITRVTDVSDPTITVYQPTNSAATRPAMIICPGGGYQLLAMNLEGSEIAAWLNSLGITGIVLKYRVPNNPAGALQDLERAIRIVRAHEKKWRVDDSRIGVIGFSAGGHLCAHLSTTCGAPAYQPIDRTDKLSCRPDFVVLIYPAYLAKGGKVPSELPVTSTVPPTFIAQAEDDYPFVEETKLYDAALSVNRVPHEFHLFKDGGHGYGLRSTKSVRAWPDDAADWLHKLGVLPND